MNPLDKKTWEKSEKNNNNKKAYRDIVYQVKSRKKKNSKVE